MTALDPRTNLFSPILPKFQSSWDATSLAAIEACPRRYQYEILEGWRLNGGSIHFAFGLAYHGALEIYDQIVGIGGSHETGLLTALWWALNETYRGPRADEEPEGSLEDEVLPDTQPDPWVASTDKKKTRATLVRAIVWWCDEQKEGKVHPLIFDNGQPATEVSFYIPLPPLVDGEALALVGYLDGLCTFGDETFIRERKTTGSTLSAYYFSGFSPNVQVDTYDLAGSIIFPDARPAGVMLEASQVAVTMARFQRQPLYRTEEQREEWYTDVLRIIRQARAYAEADEWPMNKTACMMYGGCPFRRVCNKSPASRRAFLEGGDYIVRKWDPTEDR